MKLYSVWQSRMDEDGQTAMVFGFLRHVAPELALDHWLAGVLGERVHAEALEPEDFWPLYGSQIDGQHWTEPDVVIELQDGRLVIVEAKIEYDAHTAEQLARELIDTAHARGATNLTIVALGPDLGPPARFDDLRRETAVKLNTHGAQITWDLVYSSWASLGATISGAAQDQPALESYATDVLAQMEMRGLLGYEGAPMFDDLQELTVPTAVRAFNRTIVAARAFYVTLGADERFKALGLEPTRHMWRDGSIENLNSGVEWYEAGILLSTYRRPSWPSELGLFVGFDLLADDEGHAAIHAGAYRAPGIAGKALAWNWSDATDDDDRPVHASLDHQHFTHWDVNGPSDWVSADPRRWTNDAPEGDIAWAITELTQAAAIVDAGAGRESDS